MKMKYPVRRLIGILPAVSSLLENASAEEVRDG